MPRGFHFLRSDMTAWYGNEPAWAVGETRRVEGELKLHYTGYHWCNSLYDALRFSAGSVGCVSEVSEPEDGDGVTFVSRQRTLLEAHEMGRRLGQFGVECAERALARDKGWGFNHDVRIYDLVRTARAFYEGAATQEELDQARQIAGPEVTAMAVARNRHSHGAGVAWECSYPVVYQAAAQAAYYSVQHAKDAGEEFAEAERAWQRQRFDELITAQLMAGSAVASSPAVDAEPAVSRAR